MKTIGSTGLQIKEYFPLQPSTQSKKLEIDPDSDSDQDLSLPPDELQVQAKHKELVGVFLNVNQKIQ